MRREEIELKFVIKTLNAKAADKHLNKEEIHFRLFAGRV